MDHYADGPGGVDQASRSQKRVHVGHSTGGGEVVHYIARHERKRAAKAAIISAVPPLMVKTEKKSGGLPKKCSMIAGPARANRAKFYYDLPAGPFYGFNRPGVKRSSYRLNWWRQGNDGRREGALRRHRRFPHKPISPRT